MRSTSGSKSSPARCRNCEKAPTKKREEPLFFCNIPDLKWEVALGFAVEELRRRNLLNRVVIAKSILIDADPDPDIVHEVVWPKDFRREFDIFHWSGEE